jgi:hypothetical protein
MEPIIDVPLFISPVLAILFLLFSALIVEVHYVGRLGIIGNVICSWQLLFPYWHVLPEILQFWLNVGLIIAAVAALSYATKTPLKGFCGRIRFLFGAVSVLIILAWVYFGYL